MTIATMKALPQSVIDVLEQAIVSEFATVSQAGVPIDTPTYCFPSDDLSNVGIATGLSYPAKANRARRNPKVGLLVEGLLPGQPIIAIRALASVRDADFAANARRYIAETGFELISNGLDWSGARKAVWYWTRLIVECFPVRVYWWDNAEAMDGAPHVWDAPAGSTVPASDPAPGGKPSAPTEAAATDWHGLAKAAAERGSPAHFTVCDEDGWPMPIRAADARADDQGFIFTVPKGLPWKTDGACTLTFQGLETFVGQASASDGTVRMAVERALPQHPLVMNPAEVLQPTDATRERLMARLREEMERRGKDIPLIPEEEPAPTRIALRRKAFLASLTVPNNAE
jgi:hypothetical protein